MVRQSKTKTETKIGRRSLYSKEMTKSICDLIVTDTYTIKEICNIVGINEATYYDWDNKHIEFSKAIKAARQEANTSLLVDAKHSLRKLIQGFEATDVCIAEKVVKGQVVKTVTKTTKIYKPDTASVIFALTNLDPDNWRNRQSTEATVTNKEEITFTDLEEHMHGLDDDQIAALRDMALVVANNKSKKK